MPVFLAFVRGHNALEIGVIMLVTGVAQLLTAPIAVALEQRVGRAAADVAWLRAVWRGSRAERAADAAKPISRRCSGRRSSAALAIMFCLLPPTRLALGHLAAEPRAGRQRPVQPDAQSRRRDRARHDRHGDLRPLARARDGVRRRGCRPGMSTTAKFVGIPSDLFMNRPAGPLEGPALAMVQPLVEKAALAQAINEAWIMIAVFDLWRVALRAFRQTAARGVSPTIEASARIRSASATPMRLISHSSSTPLVSRTRRRTSSPSASMSAAVAAPRLIRKLQCMVDTSAPPMRKPAAAGLVDQLPGLRARRVLECRAAGLFADRLRGFARAR